LINCLLILIQWIPDADLNILVVGLYFSCFAFVAAVVVLGFDELEEFEVFEVGAEPPVTDWIFRIGFGEFVVALVDFSGVDRWFSFFFEFLDGLDQ